MFLMFSEILTAGADRFFLKMLTFVQLLALVVRINHSHHQILPLPLASWQIVTTKLRICTKVHIFKKIDLLPLSKSLKTLKTSIMMIYNHFRALWECQ